MAARHRWTPLSPAFVTGSISAAAEATAVPLRRATPAPRTLEASCRRSPTTTAGRARRGCVSLRHGTSGNPNGLWGPDRERSAA